jgi:anti-anti-sigma regulatory factor
VNAHELRQRCERVDPTAAPTVLLDLAELTAMDTGGVDALRAAYAHFGERLVIIIGPAGAQTIDRANVREVLPIIEG